MNGAPHLQVGAWRVEPDLDRISGSAGDVQLLPKAMAVLVYLAERPGQVVGTDELIDAVWHGRPMGDNPVYKCITQLRAVLGDDRKNPTYIATVHTKGYRLIAPVAHLGAGEVSDRDAHGGAEMTTAQPRARQRKMALAGGITAVFLAAALYFARQGGDGNDGGGAPVPSVAEQPSIAVLPFANMSPGPGQDYFADGLSEELITQLANLPGLKVIGRTSSFAFRDKDDDLRKIGRTLGVNHVLEGSVRKTGNRVRITAQLINPADGTHLWSQAYDRNLEDVVTIQEEIAKTVASALQISIAARMVRRGGTESFDAYDAYLAGLAAATAGGADNIVGSIAAFERAVWIDPEFIAAWEALVVAYQLGLIEIPARRAEWLEKLEATEDRLLALGPGWPTAIVIAAQREIHNGNLVEAERLFKTLRELPPGYRPRSPSHGIFLLNVGRPHDAITVFLRDQQAEPLALAPSLWLQIAYELVGDPVRADAEYQRSLGFLDDTRAIRTMALVRAMEGRDTRILKDELLAQIAVAPLTRPVNEAMLHHLDDPVAALAELRRHLDDPANANSNVVLMMISAWAAYFHDPELALNAMGRLPPLADNSFNWAIWRPFQRDMLRLPEFKALVRERRLDSYWRTSGNWGDYCRPQGETDFECGRGSGTGT
jgi:TolB-like protein/DNA-binding winged helix-turn-helix (wHTH) protein